MARKKIAKKITKKKTVQKTAKKAIKKITKKVAKKVTKKAVKKVAKKVTKKVAKKTVKKETKKNIKKAIKKVAKNNIKKVSTDKILHDSILELIRVTSTVIPDDVQKVILDALEREEKETSAEYAMSIIKANINLAKMKSQPICQDTGTIVFKVYHPVGFSQLYFRKICEKAVVKATKLGYLRQNSVDSLTGENKTMNIGPGHPQIHFIEHKKKSMDLKLMLKGGGCENVGAQYAMPYTPLNAGRDLAGVRKVILDGDLGRSPPPDPLYSSLLPLY